MKHNTQFGKVLIDAELKKLNDGRASTES